MCALESINPFTGELIHCYDEMTSTEVEGIIEAGAKAFPQWKNLGNSHRADMLRNAAGLLRDRKSALAKLMAEEMGKPLKQGVSEVEKCAWVCEHYAEHGQKYLQPQIIETDASKSYVLFQPIGLILAVMPWNFPLWQVFRFAAPALFAGNTAILKHSSNVTGCALAIESILHDAGAPRDVFRTLVLGSNHVENVIGNRNVQAVTLTGSTPAGQSVAATAGRHLKKTVLELGGSDAYIILDDADIEQAAITCAASRMINSGQSCIAAKRFIVLKSVLDKFEELFVQQMESFRGGNPLDENVDYGPLARADLRDDLHRQVQESLKKGARLLLGGEIPPGPGAFYPPTVLSRVSRGMPVFDEETFGPVAALIAADNEEHAIALANDSQFGLGAAVFTGDSRRGEQIASERIEAGSCFVNAFVKSDPRLPFGGIKQSGYGRELAEFGIREFLNIKTVYVE
jgi:succinate-semialdehyde dehydrogenase/glutarate-semialdehyde dehydrogenase